MGKVLELKPYRSREVIEALKEMLALAEEGEIDGLCFVAKVGNNHQAGVVGEYKRSATDALRATFKLERFLTGPMPLPDGSTG